jgi:hypothetical protein
MRSARRATLCLCLAALGALAATAAPTVASAQPAKPQSTSTEASERFRAGVRFYKDGDFAAALVEFKRAYELAPNYRVLYNLGQTSQELNDYASALASFEQYLAEGKNEIDAARRKSVEGWIADLREKVGTITVETNVEGAEVLVDDSSVGTTPLDKPLVVNAGKRKLSASKEGYTPQARVVSVAGRDEQTVTLNLQPLGGPREEQGQPPPRPPPPPPPERDLTAAWVMFGVTAASGIATGVFAGLAVGARSDLDGELDAFPGDRAAIDDAQSRTTTFAAVTDILGGVTAVAGVTTIVLFAVGMSGPDAPAKQGSVQLRVAPGGFVARGAF